MGVNQPQQAGTPPQQAGTPLGWDGTITEDGEVFVNLPEGEYFFRVAEFAQKWSVAKKSPMACVKMYILSEEGRTNVFENLILHTDFERKLSAFFRSIGQKQHGEALNMNWRKVPGAWGKARIVVEKYKDKEGKEKESNKIRWFVDRKENDQAPDWCTMPLAPPAHQAAVEEPSGDAVQNDYPDDGVPF